MQKSSYYPDMESLHTNDLDADVTGFTKKRNPAPQMQSTPYPLSNRSPAPAKNNLVVQTSNNAKIVEENNALRQRLHLVKANASLRAANVLAEIVSWLDSSCDGKCYSSQIHEDTVRINVISPVIMSGRSSPARPVITDTNKQVIGDTLVSVRNKSPVSVPQHRDVQASNKSGTSSPARSLFEHAHSGTKGQFRPVSPHSLNDEPRKSPMMQQYNTDSYQAPGSSQLTESFSSSIKSPHKQNSTPTGYASRPDSAKGFGKRRGSVVYDQQSTGINFQPSEGFKTLTSNFNAPHNDYSRSSSRKPNHSSGHVDSDDETHSMSDKEESERSHGHTWEKTSSPFKPYNISTTQRTSTPEKFRGRDNSQDSGYPQVDQKGTMIQPEAQFLKPEATQFYPPQSPVDSMYSTNKYQPSVSPNSIRSKSSRGYDSVTPTSHIDRTPRRNDHEYVTKDSRGAKMHYASESVTPISRSSRSPGPGMYGNTTPNSHSTARSPVGNERETPSSRYTVSPAGYASVTPTSRDARSPAKFQDKTGFESFTVPFSSTPNAENITQESQKSSHGKMKIKPTTRLIGEICFQLDRKILNYVFKITSQLKRRRFYGYIIQNIMQKIEKESIVDEKTGMIDAQKKYILQYRYQYILNALKPLGYDVAYHPDFCADMVNKYGLLPLPPDRSTTDGIKPDQKQLVLDALVRIAPNEEIRSIHVILDCLTLLATDDNSAIISF